MRVDRWTYFATRYSLLAARGSGAGLRNFFILVLSSQFSVLTSTFLVPRDLEIPFGRPLCPCAGDEAGVSAEVLDRAVDHVMLGRAVLVLAIPFEVDVPSLGIQRRNPQRHAVRAGIDGPGDGFAVPIQIENDVRAITGTVSPIAAPRAFERVAELCESRGGDGEEKRDDGQETKRTYHPWGPFLLLAACYSRLAACYSRLAACYSRLATRGSRLATRGSLLAARGSLLAARNLLLLTSNFLLRSRPCFCVEGQILREERQHARLDALVHLV